WQGHAVDRHRRGHRRHPPHPKGGGHRLHGRAALPQTDQGGRGRSDPRAGERRLPSVVGSGRRGLFRGPAHRPPQPHLLRLAHLRRPRCRGPTHHRAAPLARDPGGARPSGRRRGPPRPAPRQPPPHRPPPAPLPPPPPPPPPPRAHPRPALPPPLPPTPPAN